MVNAMFRIWIWRSSRFSKTHSQRGRKRPARTCASAAPRCQMIQTRRAENIAVSVDLCSSLHRHAQALQLRFQRNASQASALNLESSALKPQHPCIPYIPTFQRSDTSHGASSNRKKPASPPFLHARAAPTQRTLLIPTDAHFKAPASSPRDPAPVDLPLVLWHRQLGFRTSQATAAFSYDRGYRHPMDTLSLSRDQEEAALALCLRKF
jgi:hypothetical protein